MIYDTLDSKVLFKNVAAGWNFLVDGQLYLKVLNPNPEAGVNVVNLSTNRLTFCGGDVQVNVVKVKIVDVK
jgi:hypothetical protein